MVSDPYLAYNAAIQASMPYQYEGCTQCGSPDFEQAYAIEGNGRWFECAACKWLSWRRHNFAQGPSTIMNAPPIQFAEPVDYDITPKQEQRGIEWQRDKEERKDWLKEKHQDGDKGIHRQMPPTTAKKPRSGPRQIA